MEKKFKRIGDISTQVESLSDYFDNKVSYKKSPEEEDLKTEVAKNLINSKDNNLIKAQKDKNSLAVAVGVPMGPLSASLSPMEKFFSNLRFFKKAPLAELVEDDQTLSHVKDVDQRAQLLLKQTSQKEIYALSTWEVLNQKKNLYDSTPNRLPVVTGWLASTFGERTDPFTGETRMHTGLDIAASPGTPVFSPADGVVSYVGFESGYGNLITIDHGYGLKTRYAHNSEVFVEYGQKVKRGDKIAAVGNTGRSSGAHLHYEVRLNGLPVDPKEYIPE